MQKFIVLMTVLTACLARPATQGSENKSNVSSTVGVPYNEEIVVESSLNIRKKAPVSALRVKRQFGGFGGPPGYGQSSALANADSWAQYHRPGGFGATSGIAGAQAFNSQSPYGGFGATAANTGTQGFDCGYTGCTGSAGMSGSQTYDLPGGRHVNIGYGGTFSNAGGTPAIGNSNSISFS
ncbi:hypothetical protein PVAND_013230 [Polypedilum vanderplanki]|uniref:Uncharacterized protein n=1 Tax=Polypedilum vanderplanki TaxID=319348 RepID=A0A9J6CQ18_POLVA|nr:hypothetical protein PVAND_013230 [Polypedilum vanderplanki]